MTAPVSVRRFYLPSVLRLAVTGHPVSAYRLWCAVPKVFPDDDALTLIRQADAALLAELDRKIKAAES